MQSCVDDHLTRPIVIASNRGPVSFVRDDGGDLVPQRGAGGLVTALTGALQRTDGLWVASAMSPEDRAATSGGRVQLPGGGHGVRYLAFDPEDYDRYYNGISNRILWFLHHYLWDVPRQPVFDRETAAAWESYRSVNGAFALALDQEGGPGRSPTYLVQDYHLALVPAMLRAHRSSARIAHFSHTPFAGPGYFRILPSGMRAELLAGLLGADLVGFHARPWADNFLSACQHLPGARVDWRRRVVRWQGRSVRVRVYPISIDPDALQHLAASDAVAAERQKILGWKGDAKLLVRVDRAELSKNILRGFLAFETLLDTAPEWRGRVRFLVRLNPSREDLPEYRGYLEECLAAADRINARFGEGDRSPVDVLVGDDYPHSVAALTLSDVLLVNPVFDGMNLVAKEGSLVNERDGVLILSMNTGAFPELGRWALPVDPFDVAATADAIQTALEMAPAERRRRARGLHRAVLRSSPDRWVQSQLDDLESA